jgi:hypothetical protein
LLSTGDVAGRVIAAKGFDAGDAILRAAVRAQVGSTVKHLYRSSLVENIGAGQASRWRGVEVVERDDDDRSQSD